MNSLDPDFRRQIQRLHQLAVYRRWLVVIGCWIILALPAIWRLRDDMELWREHFTWTAIRYALAFNSVAAFSLFFCVGITGAVLVWQSLYLLRGMSAQERDYLEKKLQRIQAVGPRHPLWKWVFRVPPH